MWNNWFIMKRMGVEDYLKLLIQDHLTALKENYFEIVKINLSKINIAMIYVNL